MRVVLVFFLQSILLRSGAQDDDETYYLWSMRFFMQFNRIAHKDTRIDYVRCDVIMRFHT